MASQYRKTPRASFIDYDEGDYFVTICTKNQIHYLGRIENSVMYLSEIGKFADYQLRNASEFCANVDVLLYVVMPNHIHAIVRVMPDSSREVSDEAVYERYPNPSYRANSQSERHIPVLSRYISSFKGAVTKYARGISSEFAWHGRYHDHYIRNDSEGRMISDYITNNVFRWEDDCYH